jgi:formate hydrogenlyase subunit 3/multisubunit Na+/H+ antiporter MnhD subunit
LLIIVALVLFYYIEIVSQCVSVDDSYAAVINLDWFNVVFFYILALVFLVVGLLMVTKTRRYFPGFHKDFGCSIVAATLFLSLPLVFNALDSQLYRSNDRYQEFYTDH